MKLLPLLILLLSFNVFAEPVTTSWTAPTLTQAREPIIGGLGGFNVFYGNASGVYSTEINIPHPLVTSYTFFNMSEGTYYYALTAYDTYFRESAYSSEATFTIEAEAKAASGSIGSGFALMFLILLLRIKR